MESIEYVLPFSCCFFICVMGLHAKNTTVMIDLNPIKCEKAEAVV